MTARSRVLVIGSGFGGAIAGARIAAAGFDVTIVERGPWRDSIPVRSMGIQDPSPLPTGRHLFGTLVRSIRTGRGRVTLNTRGFLEVYRSRDLHILSASNVGGGSHAYLGLHMRPPDPGYWDAAGLGDAAMERHYATVMERLRTAVPRPDHRPNSGGAHAAAAVLGPVAERVQPLPMGMRFAEDPARPRIVSDGEISRFEARPGRDGTFGSPGGGKTTLDAAYLHEAMRDHGLQVLDLTEARLIRPAGPTGSGRYRVTVRDLRSRRVRDLVADHVFVAAGTVNTLELLLRSRAAAGGLVGMPRLGERFFANGDWAFTCRLPEGRSTSPSIPVEGRVQAQAGFGRAGTRPWPLVILSTLPTADMPLPGFVKRRLWRDVIVAGMGKDRSGTVSLGRHGLVISYDPGVSPIYGEIEDAVAEIAAELGATVKAGGTPTTAHPLGGACLGPSESEAVVDLDGEVFGNPGLHVTDAAALPDAVGGPPSLTIGAWAEHVAERFISRHGPTAPVEPASRREAAVPVRNPERSVMDSWWGRHVVTRVVRSGCRRPGLMVPRRDVLALAEGDVFELGCGDGVNIPLLDDAQVRSYSAIDPSGELLDTARRIAAGATFATDIRRGRGESVPFPDAAFDTVLTAYTMCSVDDPARVLRELRRVLRPGGSILFIEHGLAPERAVQRWQRRLDPVSTRLLGNCHMSREVSGAFDRAGFDTERLGCEYVPDTPSFAGWVEWGVARPSRR